MRHARSSQKGFTLLELVISVTMLAAFVLPMLQILAQSRVRAVRYSQLRTVKSLAQRKLHDHIHYVEGALEFEGTFEDEGHPRWTWRIDPPQLRAQSEQVVLEYTIRVWVPLPLKEGTEGGDSTTEGSTYEYSVWTIPSPAWKDEQADLFYSNQPSLLYGDPSLEGYGDFYPGVSGAAGGMPR